MTTLQRLLCAIAPIIILAPPLLRAADAPARDFQPDPKSVQRYNAGYRYPQAGWIVLHIEGEPYERGYQHGRLLAPEVAAYVRCFAALQSHKSPSDGWKAVRSLVNSLFVRRYEKEYLEEMRGIADGASAAGAKFDGRPLDLVDIVAVNSWPEVDTLDSALNATPTGLESTRFPDAQPQVMPPPKEMHCSAFAATGPATADGKIVFGHITMFGLYASNFYNVWLDVKPSKGHRVMMQSYPGGIQSGMDYYQNDNGLLVCETTIGQTTFNAEGQSLASRIRKVLQYADNIDQAVAILEKSNNGLYTNEWLLGDTNTNEIAMFELGTNKTKLYRSSKGEWFGGTEGFYWGCNNTKDLTVRLETVASVEGRPANVVFHPSDRDQAWLKLYTQHKGKIDLDWGKMAFTMPPIAKASSVDAKLTTTAMAKDLKSLILFGPPLGRTWEPTDAEKKKYPEIRPLVGNPWSVVHPEPPKTEPGLVAAVDLEGGLMPPMDPEERLNNEMRRVRSEPAWHGTLLPKSDADVWLASAFANYERIVTEERTVRPSERDRIAVDLYSSRSSYLAAARLGGEPPLAKTRSELAHDDWYRVASGKGVLVLHELRRLLGNKEFAEMMDSFGRAHAGKEITAAEFQAHVEKAGGEKVAGFFDYWVKESGLPGIQFAAQPVVQPQQGGKGFVVSVAVQREGRSPPLAIDVTVEMEKNEVTQRLILGGLEKDSISITTETQPKRVVLDKYHPTRKAGGAFGLMSFMADLDQTLIVYGTRTEPAANHDAAVELQEAIRRRGTNVTLPIKSDTEVTQDDLKKHHLLLVGRPDDNVIVEQFRSSLPVSFGPRSFVIRGDSYAHAGSAVLAAGENPANPRYSMVVLAGLSAEATVNVASRLGRREGRPAEVMVVPNSGSPRALIVPAPEMIRNLTP
jgi:hypothetical protein